MNTKYYLPVLALAVAAAGCGNSDKKGAEGGIRLENLDTTVSPRADFYRYACGGWIDNNPLKPEYSRFGSFDKLAENNREQIHGLIEELAAGRAEKGSVAEKIGTLYNVAMDTAKLNADGAAPIAGQLKAIDGLTDKSGLSGLIASMRREGFDPYFALYVGPDDKNSTMNIVHTYQSGLSLGQKEYYLENDSATTAVRERFRDHVTRMFRLAGSTPEEAARAMEDVMRIETRLAGASLSNVELRDPQANYHKMTLAEAEKTVSGIDWKVYLDTLKLGGVTELNMSQIAPVRETAAILAEEPLEAQKSYLKWKVIDAAAPYLSDAFVEQNFEFYGKALSGKKEMQPRWKRAVSAVNGVLGEAVGQMYVQKYFPAEAKERMTKLVANLQQALGERIDALAWMSDTTKARAREKLAAILVKVGYPDKWRDYSALEIGTDSYWANIVRSNRFDTDYMTAKAGKPVDRSEWLMTPQTVNAYYNPATNEICFPAGILQYPFFDMNADDACNYGAIGVVIGHEMTHGFDDQGRQFDKDGNLKDWWTAQDAENFERRAQVLVDWFDGIEVLPGLHGNGRLTLGENIADHGGLQVAYQAFKNATAGQPQQTKDGFTPEQRFFLSYANVWAGNIRDEQIRVNTKSDPHSLGRWRVNGALPHIGAWYEAFGVEEGDPMYLAPEKRAVIW